MVTLNVLLFLFSQNNLITFVFCIGKGTESGIDLVSNFLIIHTLSRLFSIGIGTDYKTPSATLLAYLYRFLNSHQSFHTSSFILVTFDLAFFEFG